MRMFSNLAARETCVAETNFAARKQKMFLPGVKNIFASRTQILRPKHMFPSLATPGNITRNIVSATMFPSLARPLTSFSSPAKVKENRVDSNGCLTTMSDNDTGKTIRNAMRHFLHVQWNDWKRLKGPETETSNVKSRSRDFEFLNLQI